MFVITVQNTLSDFEDFLPDAATVRRWARAVLKTRAHAAEITIRITDTTEMTYLNETWRHKKGPTNVLSFPLELPNGDEMPLYGDIVICAEVVNSEACAQCKLPEAHWAHMVVHGLLHLLGYDHVKENEALVMETEEAAILKKLGFADPYKENT